MHHGMLMAHGLNFGKIKDSGIFLIILGNFYLQLPVSGHRKNNVVN